MSLFSISFCVLIVQENLKAVLSLLEKTEEQAVSLQQSCSMLQDELEEEEGKAAEVQNTTIIMITNDCDSSDCLDYFVVNKLCLFCALLQQET